MRDINRINPVINSLQGIWVANSDLNLGELIVEITHRDDPFYVEDDHLLTEMLAFERTGEYADDEKLQHIDNVLADIKNKWKVLYDWRLCQLLVNASRNLKTATDEEIVEKMKGF